jgi:hypothetical protein
MTTATATRLAGGGSLSRPMAVAGLALAMLALVVLAAGPLGWHAGLWHCRLGFRTLMPAAGYLGIAALLLSASGALAGLHARARRDIAIALLGMLIGAGVTYFPWHWSNQRGVFPLVDDVTTDFANPPSLAFAASQRAAEGGNPTTYAFSQFAAVQRRAYPDIVPALLAQPPATVFDKALAAVKARGWTVVRAEQSAGIIEAYDSSFWFGFTDDIALRITPHGDGSRVDIRSGARQGRGDFGANARRVQGFLMTLGGR